MNWKLKAAAQNVVAILPSGISYRAHYYVQRRWGGLRNPDRFRGLKAGADTWRHLQESGFNPNGKVFFEVGTGRAPIEALAFWLLGARKVITCDLNPYLREELTVEYIRHIVANVAEVHKILGDQLKEDRFRELCTFVRVGVFQMSKFMEMAAIDYRAPYDAQRTDLPDYSIDVHTSYAVLEHIPGPIIAGIMREARRILRPDGIGIHLVDYNDHFSHNDPNLHWLNFLRYSNSMWSIIGGNRYMYVNRLRHDDQLAIGEEAGLRTKTLATRRDERVPGNLADGTIKIAKRFRKKSPTTLAVQSAWISYRPT